MKNIHYLMFLTIILLGGCKDYEIGQFPVDSVPPKPVSDAVVENLSGKVKITYKLPNETDLLYVKAVYRDPKNQEREIKASSFKNYLEISGFGRSAQQEIKLIAVDRSQNESQPLLVTIEPQDSPIYEVYKTLQTIPTWGGIKLTWDNPTKEQLIVKVYRTDAIETMELETLYSTELNARRSVRGLDSIPQLFKIVIRDIYENCTDTLITTLKPLFEMVLPSANFKELPLGTGYIVSPYSISWKSLWDGIETSENSMYYLAAGPEFPYFTIDLGATYKLSRTKVWGRTRYAYVLHNPRYFEFWGTNDWDAAKSSDNWTGWTRLIECESYKPSGTASATVTAEDQAYAEAGEEYEFPDDVIDVRYIRFRCLETWTKTKALCVGELRFWGQAVK